MIKLFTDIFITDGYTRSVLQDMGRGGYKFIPKLLSKYIKKLDGKYEYKDLLDMFKSKKERDLFNEYYNFLTKNEYIFDVDSSQIPLFKEIELDYSYPFDIINMTFFISSIESVENIKKAISNNVFNNIPNFKFIVTDDIPLKEISDIVFLLNVDNPVFVKIAMNKERKRENLDGDLIFVEEINQKITNDYFDSFEYKNKYPIILSSFIQYEEAINFNSYFNQRLFVDQEGNIRCSPETDHILGNINNINTNEDLIKLTRNKYYKQLSEVSRNKIEICKDCELRNMCVSNDIPKHSGNYWAMTNMCCYNPYICKWNSEEDFVTVEECGNYSKEIGFIPYNEKIEELNKEIWGE